MEHGYDCCLESNEEAFRKTIIKNFPEDLKYLLNLNIRYYDYIYSAGQPLTKPRLFPWDDIEKSAPMYLPYRAPSSLDEIHIEKPQRLFTLADYENMVDKNPCLQQLVDNLGLAPIYSPDNESESQIKLEDSDKCPF